MKTTKSKSDKGAKSAKKVNKKPAKQSKPVVIPTPMNPEQKSREVKYTLVGSVPEKVSPQARIILGLLANYGDAGVTRKQLIEELKPLLKTRQPTERVLSFYAVVLKHDGIITSEKL